MHSLSAALIAVAIGLGGGYRPWHPRRGAGRTRGIHHHAPRSMSCWPSPPCCCSSR
ncbi:hypothetical protein IE989_23685 [Klebsiella pneumoniae]|nr:hypothetical protein [Klebsiella pneumoniae]